MSIMCHVEIAGAIVIANARIAQAGGSLVKSSLGPKL
jgi:hypothetical protein